MSLRLGELFAGYSGLGMGVGAVLDTELAWYSEIDKGALKILEHRYPDVLNIGDITTVDWSQVEPVDVLTGGFPCQDVSAAGKRAGIRPGTRSGLWSQFAYAISQLQPRLVVIENVRGLLSARAHSDVEPCPWCVGDDPDGALRALGAVLGDLADLGYDANWYGLRASDVGAPHGRFRVFITAYPSNAQRCGRPRWAPFTGRSEIGRTTAQGAGERTLLPTPAVNDMGAAYTPEEWDAWTERMKAEHSNGNGHGKSLSIEAQRLRQGVSDGKGDSDSDRISGDVAARIARDSGRHSGYRNPQGGEWGQYAAAIQWWESLTRPAPPPTETGPKGNPRLSAAFSEWLMGLPAGWVTDVPGITRNEALKALGNGVVPQQGAAALRWLLRHLEAAA